MVNRKKNSPYSPFHHLTGFGAFQFLSLSIIFGHSGLLYFLLLCGCSFFIPLLVSILIAPGVTGQRIHLTDRITPDLDLSPHTFCVHRGTEFLARSFGFASIILIPSDWAQLYKDDPDHTRAKIAHEIGHVSEGDAYIIPSWVWEYIVLLIIAGLAALKIWHAEYQLDNTFFISLYIYLIFPAAILFALSSIRTLIVVMEHKADAFAAGSLSKEYLLFMQEKKVEEEFTTNTSGKIRNIVARFFHPTFQERINSFSNNTSKRYEKKSSIYMFLCSFAFPIIFVFPFILFCLLGNSHGSQTFISHFICFYISTSYIKSFISHYVKFFYLFHGFFSR